MTREQFILEINKEIREIANELTLMNLIDVKYDYDSTFELEFYKDGKSIFVRNVKPEDHPEAWDQSYFANEEVIQEIIRSTDENNINIIEDI